MKRFYEDKVVPVGQPSQKRCVLARCLGFVPRLGLWDLSLSCLSTLPGTSTTSVGYSLAASR